jgi:sugar/nucleoside kinase (ribokinase family)
VSSALGEQSHLHLASYFLQPTLARGLGGLLRDARARGVTTSLDTNWDPSETWAGLADVLPFVDVLLPNLEELRAIAVALGSMPSANDEQHAHALAALGPRVVVKAGADGGWSLGPDGVIARAPGIRLEVVDTTGAGDSFDAGYLAAMASGVSDERERLRWAATAGSLSTRAVGGTAAQPDAAELTEALGR